MGDEASAESYVLFVLNRKDGTTITSAVLVTWTGSSDAVAHWRIALRRVVLEWRC